MMAILEERGIFWLSDFPVPERQFAPDASIAGTLTIDDDGHVSLELDSYFPTKHGPFGFLDDRGKPFGRDIYGVLRTSNSRAILTGVIPNGAQVKSNGISYQEFVATDCLVGRFDFSAEPLALAFDTLEVELSGFEDWFRLQSIKISRGDGRIAAEYEQPPEAVYEADGEKLTFQFDVSGIGPINFGDEFSIKQNVTLRFSLGSKETLEKLGDLFRSLEDLLILLTDSEYRVPWPSVALDAETKVRWYFGRLPCRKTAEIPKRHNCLTYFPNVRETFGDILVEVEEKARSIRTRLLPLSRNSPRYVVLCGASVHQFDLGLRGLSPHKISRRCRLDERADREDCATNQRQKG